MKTKVSLAVAILFGITLVIQIRPFVVGILQHGWGGTNYGRVVFPLVITIIALVVYRKEKQKSNG